MTAGETGVKGVVVFGIAGDHLVAPGPNKPGRAYGQGTGREFSEVIGARQVAPYPVELVLGIDLTHGGQGMSEYYHTADEFGLPIYHDLGATVNAALDIVLPETSTPKLY